MSAGVAAAEAAVSAASKDFDEAEGAESRFRRELLAARDRIADLDPPSPGGSSLADDWDALVRWGRERGEAMASKRADIAQAGKDLAKDKAALMERLAVAVAPVGVAVDPATLAPSLAAERARAERDVDHLRDRLAHKVELEETVAKLVEGRVIDDALGRQHLSASGFERWLLAEALDDIVARATIRLNDLSNGRYSLEAEDGSFHVRDHGNADERRDVRTLSGGETFLASLALALALADSIAELAPVDSPRLSSIFLDEGFGTLDGETLDVLASAIEELAASGRLVAIVTHVRDLAERMPVRFEVRKGSTTSTIERSEG
jgi:exonuclease SbcC